MQLIDSHCHLDFEVFSDQLEQVIARAQAQGVGAYLVPGVKYANWQRVLDLSDQYATIYPALGFHPYFLDEYDSQHMAQLALYIERNPQIVAIGECGLDKMIAVPFEFQQEVLMQQLALAKSLELPVILHCRKAHNELIKLLQAVKLSRGGVIHGFSGSKELALQYIKLGFKLGVGGVITYPSAKKTRKAISSIPLHSILLETDSPDMPIFEQKQLSNEPINIHVVLKSLKLVRNESEKDILETLDCSFYELFFKK